LESAATAYRKAIALKPEYVDAYTNLGVTLQQQGQLAEATAIYRKTLTLRPNLPEAHFNLAAACQQQGRSEEAISHYQQAIALRPEYAEAHFNLGNALKDQNDLEAAVAAFRQAIALRPDYADAYVNLGAVFQHQGLLDRAIGQYRQALTLRPTLAEAHLSLAGALELEGKTQEALESYRQALSLKPNDGTRIRIATILPVIIGPDENVVEMRKAFDQNLTSLLQEDLSLQDPVKEAGRTNFYLAYHGKYDRELQGKVAQLYERSCPSLLYSAPHCQGSPAPVAGRKIRVGFLSRFFWNHSIGKWMRGLIAHLSRREFEVLVFSFPRPPDEISTAIARAADRFIVCPPDLDAARQRVAQERLDILCYPDIGMEPLSYFLAFARLAPVQCTTLGHTVTTGIRTVDYFLSSALLEPADAATHYTERLVRFRHLPAYYYRPASPGPLLSRTELGLPEGKTLYVCPQSLFKLHPDFDSLLAGILQADPRGEVVLIEGHQKPWTERLQRRFRITIPAGVDRIRFVPRQPPHGFQSLLAAADVLLDSLPVGGGITTFEALHLGIPIVTLPGEFSRGRVTSACYRQMGVLDCVANSPQEYVALAVRLAQDRPYRAAVQGKILAAAGVLYENIEAVRELEQFFREAMQKLEQGPAQGSAKETRG
jgi:predicted O-linked N-acetylglucosamine transferase (SPINDLY family)